MSTRSHAPVEVCLAATAVAALGRALPALAARAVDEEAARAAAPGIEIVDAASRTVFLFAGILVVVILIPIVFLVYRRLFGAVRDADVAVAPSRDPLAEAEAEERRGNHAAAAGRFDAAGEKLRAAACWEKAKDIPRAAECYEAGGDLEKAALLHMRSGGALRAAGIYMQTKNYIEAAKIFRNKGDHLRAAQALELFGNRVAAAREYAAAGNHARAARLLEEERMYAEAAEAYAPLLGGEQVTAQDADRHATYAALLSLAGDRQRAAAAYRRVLAAVPGHPRSLAGLRALQPREALHPAAAPAPPRPLRVSPAEADLAFLEPEPPAAAVGPAPPAAPTPQAPAPPPAAAAALPSPEELAREIESDASLEAADPQHRVFSLRSMIQAGRMEPRYSMRLWVQVMRALAERHRANVVLGCVSPDSITIDMQNNVRVEAPAERPAVYLSPEVQAGLTPERQADIYAMGVVLYELVTGSTEHFGKKRGGELFPDVPAWLDELIESCTEKNLTKRYRTTEEVSAALLKLKSAASE